MLLLFALIDKLHGAFKEKRPFHKRSGDSSGADGDEWVSVMRERLQKHDQAVLKELSQLLRDFEEELLPAADATEFFDVLGILGDVLNEAPSADAWLQLA